MLASQHTFSKVTVTIFWQLYLHNSDKGSGTEIKKKKNNLNSEIIYRKLINKASASHCWRSASGRRDTSRKLA